ncbi:MAG TPA: helix-turn-helix domain-containing protein [Pseudonocardiaceae bacterium]
MIDTEFDRQYDMIVAADPGGLAGTAGHPRPPAAPAATSGTATGVPGAGTPAGEDLDARLDVTGAVAEVLAAALVSFGNAARRETALPAVDRSPELSGRIATAILLGSPPSADVLYQVAAYGIDTARDYHAFCARPGPGQGLDDLAGQLLGAVSEQPGEGLMTRLGADLVGFLTTPPLTVGTDVMVMGVGPPRTPALLAESFHLARRAADSARAFGLSGVRHFDTLGLLPSILADSDVGEQLEDRYVRPATDVESQPDLLDTIRTYFTCGMHVASTARALYLHPNTLRYRINRFEELTGARLNDPVSALEVWWAFRHASLDGAGRR